MIKKFFILAILLTIFTNGVSALTADSDSYSVSRFGTGVQATDLSSDNLESRSVLLASAGTRNAENDPLTTNIGFFENTTYYVTVSITSYSISPSSATVGSTIGLSISALNAQFVWAEITSPNGQEQNLTLTNGQSTNYLPSPSVAGRYNITFYANSSSGALASAVSHFDLTETSQSSGGGESISSTADIQGSATILEPQFVNGVTAKFEQNEKIIINFQPSSSTDIESHTITMSEVGEDSVTIIISSKPITFDLTTGEDIEVDVDGDWKNDIYLKLNGINNGKADLFIRQITAQHPSRITGDIIKRPSNLIDLTTKILDAYKTINPGNNILMEASLFNLGTEAIKDVKLKYCIETTDRTIITCTEETLAVYTKLQIVKEFLISSNTAPGNYFIKTEAIYGNETVYSETSFEVKGETNGIAQGIKLNKWFIIILIVSMIIISSIIIFYKGTSHPSKEKLSLIPSERNTISLKAKLMQLNELKRSGSINQKGYASERKILLSRFAKSVMSNKKVFAYFIFVLLVITTLTMTYKTSMTGSAINNILSYSNGSLSILIVMLFIFALLIILRKKIAQIYKKIIEFLSSTRESSNNYPRNSIKSLINKKVYSEEGNYLGKINDIILGIGRIDSLRIKMDKKYKLKIKGIIVSYKQVKSVGEIIIIDEKVSELIKGQED
ncbi:MAG: PRC-barrel domain-containing protein [Nanoarchaeota archaeon]|nr:PRC-barrel domain-containing protein [Nanoarchaeota archaeon]